MIFSRTLSLFFCALLALGGAIPAAAHAIFTEQSDKNLAMSLNLEEKDLRTELFTLVAIKDTKEWQQIKQDTREHYQQVCITSTARELAHKPLQPIIVEAIYNVFRNTKIKNMLGVINVEKDTKTTNIKVMCKNGKIITIARANDSLRSDATTDQFTILIDPDELFATHATPAEIEATIAHEIMHIFHEDDFNVFCLERIYRKRKKKLSISRKQFEKAKRRWERVQEKRADLLSGLVDLAYAQATKNHFYRSMPTDEYSQPTTHPTDRQRYEYMSELVQAMQNNNNSPGVPLAIIALLLFFLILIAAKAKTTMIRNQRVNT